MYFLSQIKEQFLHTIYIGDGPGAGTESAGGSQPLDETLAHQEEAALTTPEIQLFQELNRRLDDIENDSRLVITYCRILGDFLERVKNGEIEGYSAEDSDFVRLLELYKGRFEELKDLRDQGHSIEHIISQHMGRLNQAVDEGSAGQDISNHIVREYAVGGEINEQQELNRLQTQRRSYDGILREKISELPDFIDRTVVDADFIVPIQELLEQDPEGEDSEEQVLSLERINAEILSLFSAFDRYVYLNTPEVVYTRTMIERLKEDGENQHRQFLLRIGQLLGIDLNGIDISSLLEHQAVNEIESKEGYGRNLGRIIREFSEISFGDIPENELQQTGELFSYYRALLRGLERELDIIERDLTNLDGENTFGETRINSARQYYEDLMRNDEGLTELGEQIANRNGELPDFEDLGMHHISILTANNVNLARLFLANAETGETLESGILEEGGQYVINFAGNEHLERQMDFTFINNFATEIEVDGQLLTLRRNSENSEGIGYYNEAGNRVTLLDGSQIHIVSMRQVTSPHEGEAIEEEIQERINTLGAATTQQRAFAEAVLRDPGSAFRGETLPVGGILGMILAFLLNTFAGRNYVQMDDGTWVEGGETVGGSTLTNGEVARAYLGGMELGSLSAEFESASQGPYAYVDDDNGHGPSYGTYQMNSQVGVYRSFIQRHGIGEGRDAWMTAIEEYGVERFQEMEHQHIKENNYDPMMAQITLPNKENFTIAVQNVIWSSAVQHGPYRQSIINIINESGITPGDIEGEAQLINAIYDERGRLWPAGVQSRYRRERANALAMLETVSVEGIDFEGEDISSEYLAGLSENRRRVVSGALEAQRSGNILGAAHCTDWVDRIYQREIGRSLYSCTTLFNESPSQVTPIDSRDTGYRFSRYAGSEVISQIEPGDHIAVDHGPNFNRGRTHSVIALEPPRDGILRVVSYPNGGRPPVVELYDLTGQGRGGARSEKAWRIHQPV